MHEHLSRVKPVIFPTEGGFGTPNNELRPPWQQPLSFYFRVTSTVEVPWYSDCDNKDIYHSTKWYLHGSLSYIKEYHNIAMLWQPKIIPRFSRYFFSSSLQLTPRDICTTLYLKSDLCMQIEQHWMVYSMLHSSKMEYKVPRRTFNIHGTFPLHKPFFMEKVSLLKCSFNNCLPKGSFWIPKRFLYGITVKTLISEALFLIS